MRCYISGSDSGICRAKPSGARREPDGGVRSAGALHQQDPGLLPQLLSTGMRGGGSGADSTGSSDGGGLLASPAAKSALAGIAAMAVKQFMGNRGI